MRLILIDKASGYIHADTSNLGGANWSGDPRMRPCFAARMFDRSIGEFGRLYEDVPRLAENESGYLAYEVSADPNRMPLIADGRDQYAISAVEKVGRLIGCVRCTRPNLD